MLREMFRRLGESMSNGVKNGIRTNGRVPRYTVTIKPVTTPAAADLRRALEHASVYSVLVLPQSAYSVEFIEPRAYAVPERVRVVAGVGGRRGRARRRACNRLK